MLVLDFVKLGIMLPFRSLLGVLTPECPDLVFAPVLFVTADLKNLGQARTKTARIDGMQAQMTPTEISRVDQNDTAK